MISWTVIVYGAALTAAGVALLVTFLGKERGAGLAVAVVASTAAVVAWNAVLRATNAEEFFTDFPFVLFPVSWQDAGSGVAALTATSVAVGTTTHRDEPARRVAVLALLAGVAALAVDTYLY